MHRCLRSCCSLNEKLEFRALAIVNSTLRKDALNIVSLHVRRFLKGHFQTMPPLFDQTFWVNVYNIAGLRAGEQLSAPLKIDKDILQAFAFFRICQRDPDTNQELFYSFVQYQPDTVGNGTLKTDTHQYDKPDSNKVINANTWCNRLSIPKELDDMKATTPENITSYVVAMIYRITNYNLRSNFWERVRTFCYGCVKFQNLYKSLERCAQVVEASVQIESLT
ncbi:hypothetical protein BJV82DRAFT_582265 [Fennellomyces sp. T-0311]|nr:hypothetical protein BJV82DRAFT_582265 [Fennellomyces sp. T-0311]